MLTHWISQGKFHQYAQHLFIDPLAIRKIYRTDTNKYWLQVFCFVCWQLLTLSADCNTPYDDGLRYTIRSVVQYPTLGNLSPNKFHVPQSCRLSIHWSGQNGPVLDDLIFGPSLSLCLTLSPRGTFEFDTYLRTHVSLSGKGHGSCIFTFRASCHVYSYTGNCLYRELQTYTIGSLDSCCPRNKLFYMPKKNHPILVVLKAAGFFFNEIIKLK